MADRKLIVRIVGDERSLLRSFQRSERESSRFASRIESTLGTRAGGAAGALDRLSAKFRANPLLGGLTGGAAAIGAAQIGEELRESIGLASSLGEALTRNDRLFGDSAGEIAAWSKSTARSIGIARLEAVQAAGDFGGLFRTLEIGPERASEMSRTLVKLAADLASFNNTTPDDAIAALRSGLVGESEPLRRYQVLLSEARVAQEAYTEGIARTGQKLTEEQKVLARYSLILKDTAQAQGDFARTSEGLANQGRVLDAQVRDLQTSLGQLATPVLTNVVSNLNDTIAGVSELGGEISSLVAKVPGLENRLGGVGNALLEIAKRTNPLTGSFQLWADALNLVGLTGDDAADSMGELTRKAEAFRDAISLKGLTGQSVFSLLPDAQGPGAAPTPPFKGAAVPTPDKTGLGVLLDLAGTTQKLIDQVNAAAEEGQRKLDEADEAARAQREAFDRLMGRLSLRVDMAAATGNLRGQLAGLKEQQQALLDQVKVEGRTVELSRQLFELDQQRQRILDQLRQRRADRTQGKQFQALGLTAAGGERVPTIENLRKQLAAITERTAGTDLATPKLKSQLSGISKVLSGEFGKATRESRQKIKELFQAIRGQFKSETDSGPLTATTALVPKKILEGLGLSGDIQKELRQRLSGFNSAGAALAGRVPQTAGATPGGQQLAVEISLNGDVFDRAVVRAQQKRDRRNPPQKRGPNVRNA